jgi:hypothetical protein
MVLNNAELESFNINGNAYWDSRIQNEANDKADPVNRQGVKDAYLTAMAQLDVIIAFNTPTNAQLITGVKQLAQIQKNILLYLKSEIQ